MIIFNRDEILKILEQARGIDKKYEMFGASSHQYKLNPPIEASFVHEVEEKYNFRLPKDYFYFITEIGDGGAGPDYGIEPFASLVQVGESAGVEKFREAYRNSLAKPFVPRQMLPDEVEDFAFAKEAYVRNPQHFFVCENMDENALCDSEGYYILGTHGCQWDFGLIITGQKRGCVFDTDNEGAYCYAAESFYDFYKNWLDKISDTEGLRRELDERRKRLQRIKR